MHFFFYNLAVMIFVVEKVKVVLMSLILLFNKETIYIKG